MKRNEFAPCDVEPIKQYEKAKIDIIDFQSVYIICSSSGSGYADEWSDDNLDDDYYDDEDPFDY